MNRRPRVPDRGSGWFLAGTHFRPPRVPGRWPLGGIAGGFSARWGRLLAIGGVGLALWTCTGPNPVPVSRVVSSEEASAPLPAFWTDGQGVRLRAETTIQVEIGGEPSVRIEDLRTMARSATGDFQVVVERRLFPPAGGSEEEAFTAIAVGPALWTRGGGGPFVAWEEPGMGIRQVEGLAVEGSRDLWRMAVRCGLRSGDGDRVQWRLEGAECDLSSERDGLPFSGRVERLELAMVREHGTIRNLRVWAGWSIPTEAGSASVQLEHRLLADDLPLEEKPRPPRDVVPARRDRPVQMMRAILGGLGEWGPGAPRVLREVAPAGDGAP